MAEFDLVARESSPKKTTTVESTTTMETMATPHRSSYKTVLDQRNHSPISNSSCSSPPAPAQVPNMTSSTGLTFNIGSFANIRQSISPSKPLSSFPENDQFLSNVKSGERREQSRSPIVTTATTTTTTTSTVTMTTLTTTTNGWSKEANHSSTIHGKKGVPEHDALSGNQSSHSTSPMPIGNEPLAQLLITLKDQNKSLIREIEDLRIKLEDAEGESRFLQTILSFIHLHTHTYACACAPNSLSLYGIYAFADPFA
ncbi:hypothetical protein RDWZM_005536 [Blomia tropicalis]|uniref:Uncharacterized protein n=1 Tax=Blomia tropicalis TaxID=40697 RepID=A0A9Q0M678_BLOTA|nr:hypothetical protein RDWZM_005536 [Blomia tropicalis]